MQRKFPEVKFAPNSLLGGQYGSRIKESWKAEINRGCGETEGGSEQLAGTDTAVSDLSPTPTGKQTGTLFDLWSASLTGWPLLQVKEVGESGVVISQTCPYCSFSPVRWTLSCALCQSGISKQFFWFSGWQPSSTRALGRTVNHRTERSYLAPGDTSLCLLSGYFVEWLIITLFNVRR